jgi:DNA integrity scanning protein DisA with diadenylate cyclase activity
MAYADAGKCETAIEEFDRAIARNPYYADAWYHRALCLETLGRWDEAYESYRFLLSVNPDYHPTGNGNLSSVRDNISPPGIPSAGPSTPLIWILAGAGLAALVISGILIWYYLERLRRVNSGNQDPVTPPVRRSYPKIDDVIASVVPLYEGDPVILREVLGIAIEIAREGREGKKVGTAFILGDTEEVLERSRQLILNPVEGHSDVERMITNPDMRENIKELSLVDGAFVIRGDGVVVAAGRYISIDTGSVDLPKGFGTRHVSVAAITGETKAAGIVVSESGGVVRIFLDGRMVAETG